MSVIVLVLLSLALTAGIIGGGISLAWLMSRPSRTPEPVTAAKTHHMDPRKVRRMEWELYGRYYTALDGSQIKDGDPAAFAGEPVKPEGNRCYCNYCQGRAGVHGPEAVALYKEQVQAALEDAEFRAMYAERQKIPRTVISAGRNVVISGDASGIIVAGGDVVINQSRIGDLTPQDIAGMSMAEYAKLRRAIHHLRYDLNRSTGRATRGFLE